MGGTEKKSKKKKGAAEPEARKAASVPKADFPRGDIEVSAPTVSSLLLLYPRLVLRHLEGLFVKGSRIQSALHMPRRNEDTTS